MDAEATNWEHRLKTDFRNTLEEMIRRDLIRWEKPRVMIAHACMFVDSTEFARGSLHTSFYIGNQIKITCHSMLVAITKLRRFNHPDCKLTCSLCGAEDRYDEEWPTDSVDIPIQFLPGNWFYARHTTIPICGRHRIQDVDANV